MVLMGLTIFGVASLLMPDLCACDGGGAPEPMHPRVCRGQGPWATGGQCLNPLRLVEGVCDGFSLHMTSPSPIVPFEMCAG